MNLVVASTGGVHVEELTFELGEPDLLAAEAELRLRAAAVSAGVESLERAKVVSQETLDFQFSI